jgi:hypothetical protein
MSIGMLCRSHLPHPVGLLHYGQGEKHYQNILFFSFTRYECCRVHILLMICIMTILGIHRLHPPYTSDEYNRKPV